MEYNVGDKVQITRVTTTDSNWGVKVGDVAKVVEPEGWDSDWYYCRNPNWKHDVINMRNTQLKKL